MSCGIYRIVNKKCYVRTEEHRNKMSQILKDHKISEETRRKISESLKKRRIIQV